MLASLESLIRNHWGKLLAAQAVVVFLAGYLTASLRSDSVRVGVPQLPAHAERGEEQTTHWTCSMHPQIRQKKPGKCPICSMPLVPVSKTGGGGMRTITISPAARQLMNVQTSPVERRYVTTEIRMVGKVEYDETSLSHITAWVSGRLDRLFVDYTGVQVKSGDHMVYIYSEQLYAIQDELIRALAFQRQRGPSRSSAGGGINLVESAREKLRLLGLTDSQIKEIEQRDTPSDHITIHAPIGGVVVEKLKQEGDRVRTGDRIYTVADLTQVWVMLDAYESDLVWLRYGQEVSFTSEAYPGETFAGRIAFLDPVLNKQTRTVKVRVNVPNTDGKLKPEMFVRATVKSDIAAGGKVLSADLVGKWISPMHPEIVSDSPGNCSICGMPLVRAETLGYIAARTDEHSRPLVIPVSAAMVTGKRAIVYVEQPTAEEPTFEGREILLGPRAGDYFLVRHGLHEGEMVVTNGNFKLDSALQIQAKPTMMTPEGGGGGGHDHGSHNGRDEQREVRTGASTTTSLPPEFKSQLESVVKAFDRLSTVVDTSKLQNIRASFRELGQAVEQVDSNLVAEHPAMLWQEFSMLLSNDSVEGSEVSRLAETDRVFLLAKRHMQRMRDEFGLAHAEHAPQPTAALNVPASFQVQLALIWKAYLPLQEALAKDDLQAARNGLPTLLSSIQVIDEGGLSEEIRDTWKDEAKNLNAISSGIRQAVEIDSFRAAFALLSDEMAVVAKSFGFGSAMSIYELHCPMAFKGRGAIWLQADDATRNPYFGSVMLKCADRVELISPPQPHDAEENEVHGGSAHEH